MSYMFGIVLGFAAGLLVAWLVLGAGSTGAPAPDPAASAEPPPAPAPVRDTFSSKLQALDAAVDPVASAASHPKFLAESAEFKASVAFLADPAVPLDDVTDTILTGNWTAACAALQALTDRADGEAGVDAVLSNFERLAPWPMYFALQAVGGVKNRRPVGAPLIGCCEWWADSPVVPLYFRDYFERREALGDAAILGMEVAESGEWQPDAVRTFLARVKHPVAVTLIAELDKAKVARIDSAFLKSFGRFWHEERAAGPLLTPDLWTLDLDAAEAATGQTLPRSLLVSGEPLVGKTSFLRVLAERLAPRGWTVFEASAVDLMAGQQWFGQLEGRIRKAIEELAAAKKIIWYVPDLLSLAQSGTHQGQSASILDQILPAVTSGQLVVWTEATPAGTARLMQMRPAVRRAFDMIRLESQTEDEAREMAEALIARLAADNGRVIARETAATAVDAASHYLSASSLPGSALGLIRVTAKRTEQTPKSPLGPTDVLETLAQMTGLPLSMLDGKERLDLVEIRAFFASRVIGQPEAIDAIVDRIAMLKSGLNDPGKPIGVLLFAGPTGTGKTELAKTAADFLFSSPDRMIRLDMSEFQTSDSLVKIIGGGGADADTLITRVRKQPFSIILLDEFEKSHPQIWDLFLQVFDDGRLTDANGHVADFRHCLIILTTNLGATTHRTSGMGFAPAEGAYTNEQVLRTISQTFRPEFQNRLDKIIVFRPLSRELMRAILKKELDRVFDRRGLKDRAWAVEWEASALEFLLEKGFTPEMGARPLKRAIDQYLIAPLAATIVERRFPEGDQFVFVRSDGQAIQAEFVDPDGEPYAPAPSTTVAHAGTPPSVQAIILAPDGSTGEARVLHAAQSEIEKTLSAPPWSARKAEQVLRMSRPEFWTSPARFETLSRLALMDRIEAAAATAASLASRMDKRTRQPGQGSRELASRLALQLHLVGAGLADLETDAPVEVALVVEPALDMHASERQEAAAWCGEIRAMYRGWCARRHMQFSELARVAGEEPALIISGFGAHRVLMPEAGLHILDISESFNGGSRVAARVRVLPTPIEDQPKHLLRQTLGEAFKSGQRTSTVVRRYRRDPAPLVRSGDGQWRSGKLDAVLAGDFDLLRGQGE